MIRLLRIRNFKSIKELTLEPRRVNLFVGKPNTGKSNILEALGLLSFGGHGDVGNFKEFVRYESLSDLFYDGNVEEDVEISFDDMPGGIKFEKGEFRFLGGGAVFLTATFQSIEKRSLRPERLRYLVPFKFYRFKIRTVFQGKDPRFLAPPSGDNLLTLLLTRKSLREMVNSIFDEFGLKLALRPQENRIEVVKYQEDVLISYPYSTASDTLQRIIFHFVAIKSNENSVIVFEEPEAHSFPFHTKQLAKMIALDESGNQYFISTHNPYFLLSILEKAPREEVAVFLTYYEDYQTKVKLLSGGDIEEIMDHGIDLFFDLERFLDEEGDLR